MKKRNKILIIILVIGVLIGGLFKLIKINLFQPASAGDPVPEDATCYFAGPVPDSQDKLDDLKIQLQLLEEQYEQKKISETVYQQRKKALLESMEKRHD